MRNRLIVVLVLVTGLYFLWPNAVSYACSPASNGYVFIHEVQMEEDGAPPDLSFEQETSHTFTFANGGGAPIYVLTDPDRLPPLWEEIDLPSDFASILPPNKVIGIIIQPGDTYSLGGKSVRGFLPGFDPNQYYDDSRPELFAELPLPDPVTIPISMIAHGKLYEVPLTISYRPNPTYRPITAQEKYNDCIRLQTSYRWGPFSIPSGFADSVPLLGIGTCSLLALGGSIGMLMMYYRRRR